MICGNCGSNNPDNNGFCYSCGAPLYAPVKKKSKKPLIISAILLALIAAVVAVILIIPKSSPSERDSASKVSTPEDVAKKYMKALQKGDYDKLEDCYIPGLCTWLRYNHSEVTENLVDYFTNHDGEIEYKFKGYEDFPESKVDEGKEFLVAMLKLEEDKIDEFGRLKVEFSTEGYTYTGYFTFIKYDKKWYLILDPFNDMIGVTPEVAHYPFVAKSEEVDTATIDNSKADTSKDDDTKDDSKNASNTTSKTTNYTPEEIVTIWCEAAANGESSVPRSICYPDLYDYNNATFSAMSDVLGSYTEAGYNLDMDIGEFTDTPISGMVEEHVSLIEDTCNVSRDSFEELKVCSPYMSFNNLDTLDPSTSNSITFNNVMPLIYVVKIDGNWYILDYIIL